MSGPRRVSLTSVDEKKEEPKREHEKVIRLNITLGESNRHSCPIINYEKLVAEEKRRRARAERGSGAGEPLNGDAMEADDKENLKKIAERFEEKYGRGEGKRCTSYAELGAGYDESDSFIDNTEAFDEGLPDNVDTKHGGYYINIGPIELRHTDSQQPPRRTSKKVLESSSDDEATSTSLE